MKFVFKIFINFLIITLSYLSGEENQPKQEKELARIIVLNFENNSGRSELDYLGKSLALTIDSELKKQFHYNRKNDNEIKDENKLIWQQRHLFLEQNNIDILIYGSFIEDERENFVQIQPRILFREKRSEIHLPTVSNEINNSLLQAIYAVTKSIVTEIDRIAISEKGETDISEKKILKKEALQNYHSDYELRKNMIQFGYQIGSFSLFHKKLNWNNTADFHNTTPVPADWPIVHGYTISYKRLQLFHTPFALALEMNYLFQQSVQFKEPTGVGMKLFQQTLLFINVGYRKSNLKTFGIANSWLRFLFIETGLGYLIVSDKILGHHGLDRLLANGYPMPSDPRIFKYKGHIFDLYLKAGRVFRNRFVVELNLKEELYFLTTTRYLVDYRTVIGEPIKSISDRFFVKLESGYLF